MWEKDEITANFIFKKLNKCKFCKKKSQRIRKFLRFIEKLTQVSFLKNHAINAIFMKKLRNIWILPKDRKITENSSKDHEIAANFV